MAVVYTHTRLDNNKVFYVGIGSNNRRPYDKHRRSKHWHSVVKKCGYKIDITHKDICWEEACSIEKYLIAFYGRSDLKAGELVNMTDGGDGNLGAIVSEETRKKKSKSLKGRKHSELTKAIMSISQSNRSAETRRKISESKTGKPRSKETILKISLSKKGNRCNSKKVINTCTGIVFDCAKDAAESVGINPSTLRAWLRGQNKNKTTFNYLK